MTDAPEKIWALADRRKHWQESPPQDGQHPWHWAPYTRTDVSEAALAEKDAVIADLVKALEPFAEYMHTKDGQMDLDNRGKPVPENLGVGWVYLTHGDFRNARAALSRAKG